MLRFLAFLSLRVAVCLALFGVLIARAWGWSEYASPALYVVYFQINSHRNAYFVVNTDGQAPAEPLTSNNSAFSTFDCSPDGRVFALLTERRSLTVVTAAGVVEETRADRDYTTVNVANDGTVALFDAEAGWLRVGDRGIDLSSPDGEPHLMDRVDISPHGAVLWNQRFRHIQVVTPDYQQVLAYVPDGHSGAWLPSAQMFTYYNLLTDRDGSTISGGQYLMDVGMQRVVRVGGWSLTRPLSPDGTQVAGTFVSRTGGSRYAQVVVYDLFTGANRRQLTFDREVASQPICFLTFRPDALIANN